mgnify:CR=1 FL=1
MARPEFDADVERDALALFDAALDLAAPERVPIESLTEPFDHRTPHD